MYRYEDYRVCNKCPCFGDMWKKKVGARFVNQTIRHAAQLSPAFLPLTREKNPDEQVENAEVQKWEENQCLVHPKVMWKPSTNTLDSNTLDSSELTQSLSINSITWWGSFVDLIPGLQWLFANGSGVALLLVEPLAKKYDNTHICIAVKTFQEHKACIVGPPTVCLACHMHEL